MHRKKHAYGVGVGCWRIDERMLGIWYLAFGEGKGHVCTTKGKKKYGFYVGGVLCFKREFIPS